MILKRLLGRVGIALSCRDIYVLQSLLFKILGCETNENITHHVSFIYSGLSKNYTNVLGLFFSQKTVTHHAQLSLDGQFKND
jgi:hypothetical protein